MSDQNPKKRKTRGQQENIMINGQPVAIVSLWMVRYPGQGFRFHDAATGDQLTWEVTHRNIEVMRAHERLLSPDEFQAKINDANAHPAGMSAPQGTNGTDGDGDTDAALAAMSAAGTALAISPDRDAPV